MNRLSVFLIALAVTTSLLLGQGTTVIQTPFGPKEVPATPPQLPPQPPPPPVSPPPQPATPPPPENPGNAAARPEPQAPATAQQDDNAPIALHFVNQDIRQVIQII